MESELYSYLKKHNVAYLEHFHPVVFTVEESKNLKQSIPGIHCKCLFLKDERDNFYLVALPAQKRLDTKKLRTILQAKKLNFGSPQELREKLRLTPGSVSIFGMIYTTDVTLLINKEVWDAQKTGFHPNINTSTLEIPHQSLKNFYNSLSSIKKIVEL